MTGTLIQHGVTFITACVVLLAGGTAMGQPDESVNWVYPELIASWTDDQKLQQVRAATVLARELNAALARGDSEFVIAPGHYRFGSPEPRQLRIENAKDIHIRAEGVTFWFNGRLRVDGLVLRGCRNVTVSGLTVDTDPFAYTQGEILVLEPERKSVVIRIDPGFPEPLDWFPGGNVKAPVFAPDGRLRDTMMDWAKALEPLGQRRFRVSLRFGRLFQFPTDIAVGDRMALPDRSKRHIICTDNSENVTWEDITIYSCAHMALTESHGVGGHVYRRCRVVIRPGTKRLLACNADVFHSSGVRRGPLIESCEFSAAADDFINIHGFYGMVFEQKSPAEVLLFDINREGMRKGAQIEFYDHETHGFIAKTTILDLKPVDDDAVRDAILAIPRAVRDGGEAFRDFQGGRVYPFLATLAKAVQVSPMDTVNSYVLCGSGAIVRNSHFHDGYARGVLVKGRDNVVENNLIERAGITGILAASDRYFHEGPFSRDTVIRGNRLVDCNRMLTGRLQANGFHGAISVWTGGANHTFARNGTQNVGIVIENNTIVRPAVTGIFMANCSDSLIAGNRIEAPGTPGPHPKVRDALADMAHAIYVTHSENVVIKDNVMVDPAPGCKGRVGLGERTATCTVVEP